MFGFKSGKNTDNQYLAQIEELKKELEQEKMARQLNEKMLESVNNSAHLAIWEVFYNEKGEQTGVKFSAEMRRMLGYSASELPDSVEAYAAIIHPDDSAAAFDAFGKAVSSRDGKFDIDYRLKNRKGEYRMYHAAGQSVTRSDGSPEVFIGTFRDIEDQIRTEETLRHDTRRQIAVDKMMLEGSWSMDLTKYAIDDIHSPMIFSDQFKKILGFNPMTNEFPDIMNSWITRIHPDDVAQASAAMAKQLADPTGATVFDMEYRIKSKSEEWVWVRASSYVVWEGRTPVMAAGTILDITEQKKNRERFKNEMEPQIENLREGIADIAGNVEKATAQMKIVSAKQEEVSSAAVDIEKAVNDSMEIIGNIQSIASQTNLLSLNASIEAARAGDAGRGFAVVASEVQSLSNSTKETTEDISDKLNNVNDSVKGILSKIDQIGNSITDESHEMETINATVEELLASADEIAEMAGSMYT